MFTVLASLCAALVLSRIQLAETRSQLESHRAEIEAQRDEFHFLNVSDPANIAAVQMPKFGNWKLWQWRVHVPAGKSFRIRVAYDNLKTSRPPDDNKSRFYYDLDPGESIVSVSLEKFKGEWSLFVAAESEIKQSQSRTRVECKSTQFLEENNYAAMSAGNSGTQEADPTKPFMLVHLRESVQPDGKRLTWNTAKHGVMVWIEEKSKEKE